MTQNPGRVLTLVVTATITLACAQNSPKPAQTSPVATAPTTTHKALAHSVDLPRRTLIFKPTRDDLTVGCVVFSLVGTQPPRVNGVDLKSPYTYVFLKQLAKNEFELPAMKIKYALD